MSLFPTNKERADNAEKDSRAFAQMHSGLAEKYRKLKKEMKLTDERNERLTELLHKIPECPMHGNDCIPHAMSWLKTAKEKLNDSSSQ